MTTPSKLIFQKWKSNLPFKVRTKDMVQSNFDELFCELSNSGTSFDDAHDMINEAADAHYPSYTIAQAVYKKYNHEVPFADFYKTWKKNIFDKAMKSFFDFYNIQDNVEKKTYGSMSKEEYSKQRAYANSFETIDPSTFKGFELEDLPEDLF
jgi:hypothetical protein